MLTLEQLDYIVNDTNFHRAIREVPSECFCSRGRLPKLMIYEFGGKVTGIYWECNNCTESSKYELVSTKIRPVKEQELFYLRCHI